MPHFRAVFVLASVLVLGLNSVALANCDKKKAASDLAEQRYNDAETTVRDRNFAVQAALIAHGIASAQLAAAGSGMTACIVPKSAACTAATLRFTAASAAVIAMAVLLLVAQSRYSAAVEEANLRLAAKIEALAAYVACVNMQPPGPASPCK